MIIAIIVLVIALIGIAYYLFPPIQIVGESMYPTYYDGEIIFGRRIYSKKKLKRGDVIVYVSPDSQNPDSLDHGRRIVIKRIERISYNYRDEQLFYCLGDNSECSYDSRYYGFVPSKNLVCKVIVTKRRIFIKSLCKGGSDDE